MINIAFYNRNKLCGYSIYRVFQNIMPTLKRNVNIRELYLPSPFVNIVAIFKNVLFAITNIKSNEINHITGDVYYLLYFLPSRRTVVTVHDIMYYSYLSGIKKHIWKILYINPLKKAAKVVFISEYTKRQVLDKIGIPDFKISIIPNAVDERMRYFPKKFDSTCPNILHIGTLDRKNLNRTIKALVGIKCHLRIIGKLKMDIYNLLKEMNISFSCVGNLSDDEILEEYRQCDIVSFISLDEGFGMPVIEGQSVGRVVITSNISPMKDICGDGAFLVDPYNVSEIHEAFLKIINDMGLREKLIYNGLVNIKKYSSERVAQKYIDLYKSINDQIHC